MPAAPLVARLCIDRSTGAASALPCQAVAGRGIPAVVNRLARSEVWPMDEDARAEAGEAAARRAASRVLADAALMLWWRGPLADIAMAALVPSGGPSP